MLDVSIPSSALNSFGVVMQVTANNIANVNTDNFKARHVVLMSGPNEDHGVRIGAINRDMSPGPAVINHLSENDVRVANDTAARNMQGSADNYDLAVGQNVDRTQQAGAADAMHIQNYRAGQHAEKVIRGVAEGSNTDLPREFTNMILTQNAFTANAATIRAWDEMTGSLLNVKI